MCSDKEDDIEEMALIKRRWFAYGRDIVIRILRNMKKNGEFMLLHPNFKSIIPTNLESVRCWSPCNHAEIYDAVVVVASWFEMGAPLVKDVKIIISEYLCPFSICPVPVPGFPDEYLEPAVSFVWKLS